MSILLSTFVVLVGAGWKSVGGQLLTSGVLLLSGYQDVEPRARISASFWFFMALAFCMSALVSALSGKLWGGAAMSASVLCLEGWLIRWWRDRKTSG